MDTVPERSARREDAPEKRLVLLIEDDFSTRYTAALYLREIGYRVIEAANAAEAISVFASGTYVDFVFSDINMPGTLNGLGFAQWLAKYHPSVPILLTSGAPQEASPVDAGTLQRFIAKPYSLDEVDRRIKATLGSAVPPARKPR
jgi:CheY-like chemotaxis protein